MIRNPTPFHTFCCVRFEMTWTKNLRCRPLSKYNREPKAVSVTSAGLVVYVCNPSKWEDDF